MTAPINCHWISNNSQATGFDLKLADEVEQLPSRRLNEEVVINEVVVNRYNVFDSDNPDEQNFLFSWLNSIHVVTEEQVIRDIILFKPGQLYQLATQQESERILRGSQYIFDARIRPLRLCDNKMDVEVTTRDLWTLTPSLNFSHTGGRSKSKVALSDSNFLGTGKKITVARSNEDGRSDFVMSYHDPNILGTRRQITVSLSDNTDGYDQYINFELPFYSLATTRSYGFNFKNEKSTESIYHQAQLSSEFEHKYQKSTLFLGHSEGYLKQQSIRWRYGISFQQDNFKPTALHHQADGVPIDRRLIYPWLGVELLEDRYIKLENYHSIKRTEDINLGRYVTGSIGYSPQSLTDDESRLVLKGRYNNAMLIDSHLFDVKGKLNGFWQTDGSKFEDLRIKLSGNYYNFHHDDWVFFTSLTLNYGKALALNRQLFLGGDNGLRGYPVRHVEVNKSVVINIEERFYSDWYWFNLIRVGAAAYLDIGKGWNEKIPLQFQKYDDDKWLANIGVGLRLTPTRADANHVIHLDLAFPIDAADTIDKTQFIIKVKQSF